jgi:hypothetical protein
MALCAILLTATIAAPPAMAASRETVAMSVGRLLEEGHYTRQKLNEEVSKKFLQTYLEMLDFSHLFFTQKDVDELKCEVWQFDGRGCPARKPQTGVRYLRLSILNA